MIEDSLKNIRNIYRLILTVSFLTIVFSLSIDFPKEKELQLQQLINLNEFPFLEYDEFIAQQIRGFERETLKPISEKLSGSLENNGFLIFNLHHLPESFSKNIHVGKLLPEELVFQNVSDSTLNGFETINVLPISQDVQVIVPQLDQITPKIIEFLEENRQAGLRLDNISLAIDEPLTMGDSYIPGDDVLVSLYFELPANIRTAGAPVFNADFPAKIISLPNTSFISWMTAHPKAADIAEIHQGELVWLPNLKTSERGFYQEKIGLLMKQLERDIESSSPEEQKVPIFGATVPGVLFIFAAPIILVGLLYYLSNTAQHLAYLSKEKENRLTIGQFAWSPLSLRKMWYFDALSTIALLPGLSLIILSYQISQFEVVSYVLMLLLAISVLIILLFSVRVIRHLQAIRDRIGDR